MANSVASGPGRSMEKLRARKKSGSGTQRFWSTSSRCMIAICPAGPPKLMKPSFSQKRKASAKLIALDSSCTRLRLFVGFFARRKQPVVHEHAVLEQLVVVCEKLRQAERKRGEPGRLG